MAYTNAYLINLWDAVMNKCNNAGKCPLEIYIRKRAWEIYGLPKTYLSVVPEFGIVERMTSL